MKGNIYCDRCREAGRKPQLLGKCEEIRGRGDLYLWCKKCRREIRVPLEELSLDK